jgi:hypothetical protein
MRSMVEGRAPFSGSQPFPELHPPLHHPAGDPPPPVGEE